jgi:hypothetical protein
VVREEAVAHKGLDGAALTAALERALRAIEAQVGERERQLAERSAGSAEPVPAVIVEWLQRLAGAHRLNHGERCRRLVEEYLDSALEAFALEARDFDPAAGPTADFRIEPSSEVASPVTVLPAIYRRGQGRLLPGRVCAPPGGALVQNR